MELESVGVVLQLSAEVAVAGSGRGTDDGNVLAEQWQAQFALQVEDTLFFQLPDNLLTLTRHVANGIGRVNV